MFEHDRKRPSRFLLAALLVLGFSRPLPAKEKPKEAARPAPTATAPVEPPRITLKWTTASEVDNYGYFVHRSETKEGPFRPLNDKALPGAGTTDLPSSYKYEDFDVVPGKTYFYYLESLSIHGAKEKFSGVIEKVCCGKTSKPEAKAENTPTPPAK